MDPHKAPINIGRADTVNIANQVIYNNGNNGARGSPQAREHEHTRVTDSTSTAPQRRAERPQMHPLNPEQLNAAHSCQDMEDDQLPTPVQVSNSADDSANSPGTQAYPSQSQVQASGDSISAGRDYDCSHATPTE